MNRRQLLVRAATGASAMAFGSGAVLGRARARSSGATDVDYASTDVRLLSGTPRADGFRMPAEWEPHERTIMAFPTPQPWLRNVAAARQEWAAVAQAVAEFEPVLMVANQSEGKIAEMLCGTRRVSVVELPLDSAWTRDTGPLFLTDGKGKRRAVGFTFNGWGDVQPHERDALLKARLCDWLRTEMYAAPLVLEGGGITVDGEGTLISTEECLLNANRNPGVSREALEKQLGDYLGVEKVVWLGQGLKPDPVTDGHVDGLCVFVRPGVVMLHTTDVESDPNHALCRDARERLLAAKDAKGRALEVIELPLGGRDVAHINFYLCNGAVVVPTTGDKKLDDAPLARIREAFPERKVVGVKALAIAQGGGGVHCITQQVPAKG